MHESDWVGGSPEQVQHTLAMMCFDYYRVEKKISVLKMRNRFACSIDIVDIEHPAAFDSLRIDTRYV